MASADDNAAQLPADAGFLTPPSVMHLPELAAVGTLGFARRVKGRRGSNSIAEEQTQIWPGTTMVQAGRPQLGSRSVMDQGDMRKLEDQS